MMNPSDYLQSRFVSSQIGLNKQQTTNGHGENHAILAWMWVVLKALTVWHFVVLLGHYVFCAIARRFPKRAMTIVADHKAAAQAELERNAKVAEELAAQAKVTPIKKETTQ